MRCRQGRVLEMALPAMMLCVIGCGPGSASLRPGTAGEAAAVSASAGRGAERITRRHLSNFQLCAERNPRALLHGQRLELDLGVTPGGRVNRVEINSQPAGSRTFAACVSRTLYWIRFSRTHGEYRRYRLGMAIQGDRRVRVDLDDLDASQTGQVQAAGAVASGRPGWPAELDRAIEAMAGPPKTVREGL